MDPTCFKVIDKTTGDALDIYDCVVNKREGWLMEGNIHPFGDSFFALTEYGDLIFIDHYGNYRHCPHGRFEIQFYTASEGDDE